MQASLLEILREIPDHRRAEGKRFDLATVLLYSILAMVAGRTPTGRCTSSSAFIASLTRPSTSSALFAVLHRAAADLARHDPAALETAFRRQPRRSRSRP